jgi:hypothetical protein
VHMMIIYIYICIVFCYNVYECILYKKNAPIFSVATVAVLVATGHNPVATRTS